jgi:hypothetical protein
MLLAETRCTLSPRGWSSLTRCDRFFQILDCLFLASKALALLVVEPAELLQNLCMLWVAIKNATICSFGIVKLELVSLSDSALASDDLRLFVAREHDQSGTRCLPLSVVEVDRERYI